MKKETYETGLEGERLAERYLTEHKGMTCLARRARNRGGEIDLVMLDGECVVFVEVKTRKTAEAGEGLQAVDARKQIRLARAAELWLMSRPHPGEETRFDVVEIGPGGVLHVPNAFQPAGGLFY